MTQRVFGLGPRHRVMFDIPQQPRPPPSAFSLLFTLLQ